MTTGVEFLNLKSKGLYPFTAGTKWRNKFCSFTCYVYVNITHYTCVQYFRRDFLSPWFPQYGNTCWQTMIINKDDDQQAATVNGAICHKKRTKKPVFNPKSKHFLQFATLMTQKLNNTYNRIFQGLYRHPEVVFLLLILYTINYINNIYEKHTLNWGINLVTSCCQLCSVEAGATTRNGPQILWVCRKDTNTYFIKIQLQLEY